MHIVVKSTLHTSHNLATLPYVLDIVEQMIGPNILLYNITINQGAEKPNTSAGIRI